MARTGVTYQEIELQADLLVARGENPTLEKVRRGLGDRGSNSTLSKYINEWRGRRPHNYKENVSTPTLPDPVHEAVKRIWIQLKEESETKTTEAKREAQLAIEKAYALKDLMGYEKDLLLKEVGSLKDQLFTLKIYNSDLESALHQAQKELERVKGRSGERQGSDEIKDNNDVKNDVKEENERLKEALQRERGWVFHLEEKIKQIEQHARKMAKEIISEPINLG